MGGSTFLVSFGNAAPEVVDGVNLAEGTEAWACADTDVEWQAEQAELTALAEVADAEAVFSED